jgi:hypothetical protein
MIVFVVIVVVTMNKSFQSSFNVCVSNQGTQSTEDLERERFISILFITCVYIICVCVEFECEFEFEFEIEFHKSKQTQFEKIEIEIEKED